MVALRESFNQVYEATPSAVGQARAALADFAALAGARRETIDAIRLASSEAITNAVIHAYRGRPGTVTVTAAIAGDELWLLVTDEGVGHQAPAVRPGLGWGLALIADAVDAFEIAERSGGGTEVRMRFNLRR